MSNAKNQIPGMVNNHPPIRPQSHQGQPSLVLHSNTPVYSLHQPNSISIAHENKKVAPHQHLINQQQPFKRTQLIRKLSEQQKSDYMEDQNLAKFIQKQIHSKNQSYTIQTQHQSPVLQKPPLPPIIQKYVITKTSYNKFSVNKVNTPGQNIIQTPKEPITPMQTPTPTPTLIATPIPTPTPTPKQPLKQNSIQTPQPSQSKDGSKSIQLLQNIQTTDTIINNNNPNIQPRSKYQQIPDPETHIYNIPKFQQMMSDLLHEPVMKVNTKRMIQKEIETFWNSQQSSGSTTSIEEQVKNKQEQEKVPPKLEDFIKGKKLGKGMFGEVFLVEHKETGFVCALKVLSKEVLRIQKVESQFVQELKLHSFLDHPNIVQVYGYFDDKQNIYVMQQICTGGQLFDLLIKRRRISEKRTAYYMKQLVQGLRYIHTMDITHRDIKPENILIESGVIKICDFGWAIHSIDNQHKGKCGTPLYLSPEVVQDNSYCELVDVWGVGLITYQLLVGNIPWNIWTEEDVEKIVKEDISFPQYIPISDTAKDFIEKTLIKNPEQRITLLQTFTHPFLIGVNPMEFQDESYTSYGQATP